MTPPDGTMLHPEFERLDRDELDALQRRKLKALGERLAASPERTASRSWCCRSIPRFDL